MKTFELTGAALDWAVAKCEGYGTHYGNQVDIRKNVQGKASCLLVPINREYVYWNPSTNWAQGGPIIEREKIELLYYGTMGVDDNPWEAQIGQDTHYIDQGPMDAICGSTPLIAAMRCYCCAKLGDEIEIPEELQPCQQSNI